MLAVARPRSLWQWTLTTRAGRRTRSTTEPTSAPNSVGDGVADGVGDVDRGRAGVDDRLVDSQQELRVGARGVLGGELDRRRPSALRRSATHSTAGGEHLLAGGAELVLEVDVAGGDEDVEARALGDADGLHRPLRVAVATAREGGHGHALRLLGDPVDGVEVAGRGGREAGLDDVHVEAHELARDLELLLGGQRGAGRLLAVAQGRVEDADAPGRPSRPVRVHSSLRPVPAGAGHVAHQCPPVAVEPLAEACA